MVTCTCAAAQPPSVSHAPSFVLPSTQGRRLHRLPAAARTRPMRMLGVPDISNDVRGVWGRRQRTRLAHVALRGAAVRAPPRNDCEHVVRPHVQVHHVLRERLRSTGMQPE